MSEKLRKRRMMNTENITPGPWKISLGGGHAHNSILGSDVVQVSGWLEDRIVKHGGQVISNRSYSEMVCENLGDLNLPGPKANAQLIAIAPLLLRALKEIASFKGQTLLGDGRYNEGANRAFEKCAAIAIDALESDAEEGES